MSSSKYIEGKGKVAINSNIKDMLKTAGIVVTIGGTLVAGNIGGFEIYNKNMDKNRQAIYEQYGVESEEGMLIQYLDLNNEINECRLDKYTMSSTLSGIVGGGDKVSSPQDIKDKLNTYNITKEYSKTNLDAQYEFVRAAGYLKGQSEALDKYIRKSGYSIVYDDFLDAIKELVGETYGINPKKVKVYYEENSGESHVKIEYGNRIHTISSGKISKYMFDLVVFSRKEDKIKSDMSDAEIRRHYTHVLGESAKLRQLIAEKDFYNERQAKKL